MFTGIMIGLYAAFWIYMIYYRYRKFDSQAFQSFMLCSGAPFLLWCLSRVL